LWPWLLKLEQVQRTIKKDFILVQKYLRRFLFNRWAAFIHDLLWVPAAIISAYWFRFNLQTIPPEYQRSMVKLLILSIPAFAVLFRYFGLYRGLWRFASIPDLGRILKSVSFGALIVTLISGILFRLEGIPRSVLLLFPLLLTVGLAGPRLSYRWFKDHRMHIRTLEGKRTLVVGAGHAGMLLLSDLIHSQQYQPVALVDDDPEKQNREIHGVRVVGTLSDISEIVNRLEIELVLLAMPSAPKETVKRVLRNCAKSGVECQTVPSLTELTDEKLDTEILRPITLEDLLGRETIELDKKAISAYLRGKCVLVTGAGGSIGSELCRQVAQEKPSLLIIFDNGEFNLYSIDLELRNIYPDLNIITVLGDVKNKDRIDWVFRKFNPNVVFHAAAYKHVPMVEINPAEGAQNNVIGTRVVADAADKYKTERFVLISTDKAVNPANVMGATKRVAELYCQNFDSRSNTKFITTRFGNVLGSAGSVVPLFEKQIKSGGPVTVTHKDISRFFMTIPESVNLILQAGTMGNGGEIYVLDMGEPVLIRDLAKQMIRLSGYEPGRDIEIVYTGLRPGEKLYEEIFHESEKLRGTSHPKLLLASSRKFEWEWLINALDQLQQASLSRDVGLIVDQLRLVVPEYTGKVVNEDNKEIQNIRLRLVDN